MKTNGLPIRICMRSYLPRPRAYLPGWREAALSGKAVGLTLRRELLKHLKNIANISWLLKIKRADWTISF